MAKRKYPKEIFIEWECPENDEPFMVVHQIPDTVAVAGDTIEVAIYRLVRTAHVTSGIKVI